MIVLVPAFAVLLTTGIRSARSDTLPWLSGGVYFGELGDTSTGLGGVTVTLYGSNQADELGDYITSTTTAEVEFKGLYLEMRFLWVKSAKTRLA